MSTTGSSSVSSSRSNSPDAGESLESQIHARDNPHWKLAPPKDTRLIEHNVDAQEFDWDAVNDDDNEIWLIRAPSNLKAKHLEDLQLDTLPAASSTAKNMRSGRLVRGEDTFDLWALGTLTGHEDDDSALAAAGGEMNGLSCLLPRKSKAGKLYAAPKTPTRRFVLSMQPVRPVAPNPEHGAFAPESLYQNPPRPSYAIESLKHQFIPYGHSGDDFIVPVSMDVDIMHPDVAGETTLEGKKKKQEEMVVNDKAEKAGKKRKGGTAKEDKATKKKAKVAA